MINLFGDLKVPLLMNNKLFNFLLKIIISLSLMIYLIYNIFDKFDYIFEMILNIRLGNIFFAFLILTTVIQIYRWLLITKKLSPLISYNDIINSFLASTFAGVILPSSIGFDATRIIMIVKKGVDAKVALISVILDRISGLFALLLMIIFFHSYLQFVGYRSEILVLGLWISVALIVPIIFIFLSSKINVIPKSINSRISFKLFSNNFVKTLFSCNLGSLIFATSFLIQLLVSFSIFFISQSLQLEISLWTCISLVPIIMLVSAFPISFSGWGVREGAMILAFALFSVPSSSALLTSIFFGLLMSLVGIVCGLLWILNFRWTRIFLSSSDYLVVLFSKFK